MKIEKHTQTHIHTYNLLLSRKKSKNQKKMRKIQLESKTMKMLFPPYAQMELVCRISHLNGIGIEKKK